MSMRDSGSIGLPFLASGIQRARSQDRSHDIDSVASSVASVDSSIRRSKTTAEEEEILGPPEAPKDDPATPTQSIRNGFGKVTLLTQNSLGKASEITAKQINKASTHTTKHIGSAIKQSEEVYETSRWCFWARFIGQFPLYFPRTFSITFGVLVPLWLLILISAGFGIILADYEAIEERTSNHIILESQARINRTFVERTDLGRLPVDCFLQYVSQSNRSLFAERIDMYLLASSMLEELKAQNETNITDANMTDPFFNFTDAFNETNIPDANNMTDPFMNFTVVNETETIRKNIIVFNLTNASATNITLDLSNANHTNNTEDMLDDHTNSTEDIFPSIINYTLEDVVMETEEDILHYITQCQADQNAEIQTYLEEEAKYGDISASTMTFKWNRCWSHDINKVWGSTSFVFFPPMELIEASRPSQQAASLETEFVRILDESEKACLDYGGDETGCFEEALQDAVAATGDICHDNVEGTSWFFFTIMTTIGYGNQVPITQEGRLLIYIAGIACLILFAAVLGSSGYILLAIFDDFVCRFWVSRFLKYPLVGVALWGGIWIGWAYGIASNADNWWQERIPDFDVDRADSLWFAFISTATIGLGDYFLQPEVMFASDALWFSVAFLIGFVLLSTFLNKIGEFLFSILPKRDNSLEARLKETNIFFWKHWPCIDVLKTDYLRSLAYDDNSKESDESQETDEPLDQQQQRKQQAQRVEVVMSLMPNQRLPPPLNTMFAGDAKTLDDLLDQEEMMLKALLESFAKRRTEMRHAATLAGSGPAKKAQQLMTVLSPLPDSGLFSESDAADDDVSISSNSCQIRSPRTS